MLQLPACLPLSSLSPVPHHRLSSRVSVTHTRCLRLPRSLCSRRRHETESERESGTIAPDMRSCTFLLAFLCRMSVRVCVFVFLFLSPVIHHRLAIAFVADALF